MAVSLARLCAPWPELNIEGDASIPIDTVVLDSREARHGALFVAVAGHTSNGHAYLPAALASGCQAVVVANDYRSAVSLDAEGGHPAAIVSVPDTKSWPARLARQVHQRPEASMLVAGITGTNGKTTVAFLLRSLLGRLAGPCGLLGTIRYETGGTSRPSPLTTPDGPTLYGLLAEMRDHGCRSASLEISSHGLDQERTADLALDVAVLTNLGRDHLDYHRDQADYLRAKIRILELLRPSPVRGKVAGVAVVNAADPAFAGLDVADLVTVRYATDRGQAAPGALDLCVVQSELSMGGSQLVLEHKGQQLELKSHLVGRFNVENLTAALAAGLALGLPAAACCAALGDAPQVPGRLQRLTLPNGALAVVDYAHTPEALAAALTACRELTPGRLGLVFGCGGDRDRGKRPLMGAVAAREADRVWITSDNPRSEEPAAICAAIEAGFAAASSARARKCHTILDRTTAIEAALAEACEGDLVLVAGKGHEDYQLVKDRRLVLDDSVVIRNWIACRESHG